jgi:hypothetical protein
MHFLTVLRVEKVLKSVVCVNIHTFPRPPSSFTVRVVKCRNH